MELEGPGVRVLGSAPICSVTLVRSSVHPVTCLKYNVRQASSSETLPSEFKFYLLQWFSDTTGWAAGYVPFLVLWYPWPVGSSRPLPSPPRPGACSLLAEYQSLAWTLRLATCFFWMWFLWMGLVTAGRAGAGSPVARQSPACLTGSTFTLTLLPLVPTGCGSLYLSIVSSSLTARWTPTAT